MDRYSMVALTVGLMVMDSGLILRSSIHLYMRSYLTVSPTPSVSFPGLQLRVRSYGPTAGRMGVVVLCLSVRSTSVVVQVSSQNPYFWNLKGGASVEKPSIFDSSGSNLPTKLLK